MQNQLQTEAAVLHFSCAYFFSPLIFDLNTSLMLIKLTISCLTLAAYGKAVFW